MNTPREDALRPLRGARDAMALLRVGGADADLRAAFLRVCEAIDGTLRRLVRDDDAFGISLRLRALDSEDLSPQDIVATLRQHDRLSIELAAAFHDLLAARRRIADGAAVSERDSRLTLDVAERLEREALIAAPAAAPADLPVAADEPAPAAAAHAPPRRARRFGPGGPVLIAAALVALLLLSLGVFWWARRGPAMDEAIALFRSGDYARAAAQFERYAAANPRETTPRLYLARIYRRTGRTEQAAAELRAALETAPADPALHRELGFLLLDVGRADAAATRFRTAVELDPESTDGWVGLIRALRESGQGPAAERVLARAPAEVRALLSR